VFYVEKRLKNITFSGLRLQVKNGFIVIGTWMSQNQFRLINKEDGYNSLDRYVYGPSPLSFTLDLSGSTSIDVRFPYTVQKNSPGGP